MNTHKFVPKLVAPCGMNCAICIAFLRDKKKCPGCRVDADFKTKSCVNCTIKNCCLEIKKLNYCFECDEFPCKKLQKLDIRYRSKYHMSMIANLETIRDKGIPVFLKKQTEKWSCRFCGGTVSCHKSTCSGCGRDKSFNN